jgi:hypothetical protein
MVFRYLSDPIHLTEFCTNVVEVSDVRHLPGNTKFAWVYKMIGVRIIGEAAIDEILPHQQLTIRFYGGVQGSIVWQLQAESEGTFLEIKLDYILPAPLLKKHSETVILRQNEYDIESTLVHLQTLLEAHHARTLNRV